jgi:hypothetical protein
MRNGKYLLRREGDGHYARKLLLLACYPQHFRHHTTSANVMFGGEVCTVPCEGLISNSHNSSIFPLVGKPHILLQYGGLAAMCHTTTATCPAQYGTSAAELSCMPPASSVIFSPRQSDTRRTGSTQRFKKVSLSWWWPYNMQVGVYKRFGQRPTIASE